MNTTDRDQRSLITGSLVTITGILVMMAMAQLSSVLIPFVLAIFVSYLVSPLVDTVQIRWGLPRGVALLAAIVIIVAGGALFVVLLVDSFSEVVNKANVYRDHLVTIWERTTTFVQDEFGIALGAAENAESILDKIKQLPIEQMALDTLGTAATLMSDAGLVLLFTIYILVGRSPKPATVGIWGEIDQSVRRYIVVKVYTSSVNAIVFGLILFAFGVDLALVFALLSFMLNFIPNIGSLIAIVLPLPVAIVTSGSGLELGIMMLLLVVNQNVIGNVIEPKLLGKGLDLHPVTVLLGLALWGSLWGPMGMLLSAPLMAVMRIILDRYPTTRPAAELLSGRYGENASLERDTDAAAT